jgi:hypothetical protein
MSFCQLKTNTMKNSRITTIVLVVLFISTLSFAQKTIDKVFSGVKTINLSTASGNGYVKRSSNNEVKVTLEYTFDDEDYKPSFEQDGDRLVIKEKFENSRWNRGYAKWTLEVPNGMELEFKTGSGNIEVDGVDMDILAKSGSGDIEVSDLSGVMRINTGSGDIDLSNVKGQSKGNTGSGNITLSRVEGDSDFNTGSGNIRARGISGAVDFNTGSGNIELIDVEIKGRSRINTGSGNAELELSSQLEPLLESSEWKPLLKMTSEHHSNLIECLIENQVGAMVNVILKKRRLGIRILKSLLALGQVYLKSKSNFFFRSRVIFFGFVGLSIKQRSNAQKFSNGDPAQFAQE